MVEEQIHKALDRKVWLPSGGYLIIDRTEALTVIDVNTGKSVGQDQPRGHRRRTPTSRPPRRSPASCGCATSAASSSSTSSTCCSSRTRSKVEDTMREAMALRQDTFAGLRHRPARAHAGDPQACIRRPGRVVLRDLSHLRGSGHPAHHRRTTDRSTTPTATRKGSDHVRGHQDRRQAAQVLAGDVIEVEKIVHEGDTVTFEPLLVVDDDGGTHVGAGRTKATVTAKPLGETEGRQDQDLQVPAEDRLQRRPPAHRQTLTLLEIEGVELKSRATSTRFLGDPYGTQEGRRLVPERSRLQRQAPRREGLRWSRRSPRARSSCASAARRSTPATASASGGDDTLFALRDGTGRVPPSPADASSRRSFPPSSGSRPRARTDLVDPRLDRRLVRLPHSS